MQCERLFKLTKSWYLSVQDETMAPARMLAFIEKHAANCEICLADPDLKEEIARIAEIILPESKVPKTPRQPQDDDDESEDIDDELNEEESEELEEDDELEDLEDDEDEI